MASWPGSDGCWDLPTPSRPLPQRARDWIATLDRLTALDATVIVPGHGEILRDKKHLLQLRDLMKSVLAQVENVTPLAPAS
jgi:glyoxylase-like metal-dependent hydrolase (beta-lactamase superfamily II)